MPPQTNLSPDVLNAALAGLEAQKQTIEAHIEQVRILLGIRADGQPRRGRPPKAATVATAADVQQTGPTTKRHFSAAARKRMAAAQRQRWAAKRAEAEAPVRHAPRKRRMSAEGRKRIAEAARKRWAAVKKAKGEAAE